MFVRDVLELQQLERLELLQLSSLSRLIHLQVKTSTNVWLQMHGAAVSAGTTAVWLWCDVNDWVDFSPSKFRRLSQLSAQQTCA
jgi:hypothetical protein